MTKGDKIRAALTDEVIARAIAYNARFYKDKFSIAGHGKCSFCPKYQENGECSAEIKFYGCEQYILERIKQEASRDDD
jgi:hypothetical protein